jgi:hypothetical protein
MLYKPNSVAVRRVGRVCPQAGGAGTKSEIRISKSETNYNARNSKFKTTVCQFRELEPSDFGFVSCFGFRDSNFSLFLILVRSADKDSSRK